MKKLNNIILILVGIFLAVLILNDFVPLLVEYVFGVADFKLPIKFSPGGWKVKYWLMDHDPGFEIYQILYLSTGFLLIFSGLFQYLGKMARWSIIGGLIGSALFVFLFNDIHYLVQQTPAEFMIAQIVAGIFLIPATLHTEWLSKVRDFGLYFAAFLVVLFTIVALIKTPVTLIFMIWPLLGIIFLFIQKKRLTS